MDGCESHLLRSNRILILASAVFYYSSSDHGSLDPASLFDAHALIKSEIGKGMLLNSSELLCLMSTIGAALLFALALLAAGQSASIVATVAGQSVSEGFLRWKVSVRTSFSDSTIVFSDQNLSACRPPPSHPYAWVNTINDRRHFCG